MSATAFPALGFDPVPGDVAAVQREATRFAMVAHEVAVTTANLVAVDAGSWKGEAATAFVGHVHSDLTPLLKELSGAFTQASGAMNQWARQLASYQEQARLLEQRAEQAMTGVATATRALANSTAQTATAAGQATQRKLRDGVTSASTELNAIRREAEDLRAQANAIAKSIAGELQHAGNMAPRPPGWLDSLAHDVEKGWDDTWGWVKDHADLIKTISSVLSDISTVLQIVAIFLAPFEPIGGIVELVAMGFAAEALLTGLLAKAAGANESWASLGMDALGVVPFLGGTVKALSGTVKVAEVSDDIIRSGDAAARIEGAIGSGKPEAVAGKVIKLFGKDITIVRDGWKITGIKDISKAVYEQGYQAARSGSFGGTEGLRLAGRIGADLFKDNRVFEALRSIDSTSGLGKGIDVGVKVAAKAYAILVPKTFVKGVEKDVSSLGDSFVKGLKNDLPTLPVLSGSFGTVMGV